MEACEKFPANPSSPHRLGRRADAALEGARHELARLLGAQPLEIVPTSGATEAANAVFHQFGRDSAAGEVWMSAVEHPAVRAAAMFYCGDRVRVMPVSGDGLLELDWLERELRARRPALVALMAANNETGVLQPWRQVSKLCREQGVPLLCDATQWLGKMPAEGLGQNAYVFASGHKFGGPRGIGFLKTPSAAKTEALLHGGPQAEGRRAGTENVPGFLAMLAALRERERVLAAGEQKIREGWRDAFEKRLCGEAASARIVGARVPRLWNTSMAILPDAQCAFRWVVKLDKAGFAVSTGSACSSGSEVPSPVLVAMGLSGTDISNAVRFSAGWETTAEEWGRLAGVILELAGGNAAPPGPRP